MLTSLGLVFLAGLAMSALCRKIHLPRIIGMLITGIILGPCVLDLLEPSLLNISAELRKMALIIILIKAGLSLNAADLRKIGRPALLMSFLPAVFEIAACTLLAPWLLGCSAIEGALIGAVLGAVSPAVVVPRMVTLMEKEYGTQKQIPQLIMAGASLDDVFVIVLFSAFLGMSQGNAIQIKSFLNIPVSIVMGIILGAGVGWAASLCFEICHRKKKSLRNTIKVIVILGLAFMLMAAEDRLEGRIAVSGLLAVMSMAAVIRMNCRREVTHKLSEKFGKLWLAAEVILFVLVGAAVDIRYTMGAGGNAVVLIILALAVRSVGVVLSLLGTKLDSKERLFCVLSYLPKATVQAAIGSVPLAMGMPCGEMVLSTAVLSILLTAPAGAIAMDAAYSRLLKKENKAELLEKTDIKDD